ADAIASIGGLSGDALRLLMPALNLLMFLALIGSLGTLVRDRFTRLPLSTWLDAVISTLGLLCVAFFLTAQAGVAEQAT
ncbi:hypothetical protein ACMWQU_27185, partial [Escherichia coli]|uniref:hypothetical protein n=1 Tax=Escherichia coli TaxID=562 RepID=UPI0039E186BC